MTNPSSLIIRIIDWLRAGYPEGVPREDYLPLLGVLHRSLTDAEVTQIAADLSAAGAEDVSEEDIAAMIRTRAYEEAGPSDIARVSARLAEGGWPLASGVATEPPETDTEPSRLTRIVSWLREGYPTGVPANDFIPLVALLRRRLTDDEVKAVAKSLRTAGVAPAGAADIGVEITRLTNELPSAEDITRVHQRLAKKGWPVEFPDPDA